MKTVTFSFDSSEYDHVEATETFTLEALGIDEALDEKSVEKELEQCFQSWLCHKLNISWSIVMEKSNTAE